MDVTIHDNGVVEVKVSTRNVRELLNAAAEQMLPRLRRTCEDGTVLVIEMEPDSVHYADRMDASASLFLHELRDRVRAQGDPL